MWAEATVWDGRSAILQPTCSEFGSFSSIGILLMLLPNKRTAVRLLFDLSWQVHAQLPGLVLGSGLIDPSQKITLAARATAVKKAFDHETLLFQPRLHPLPRG